MNDFEILQNKLNSDSPDELVECPSLIAKIIFNSDQSTITKQILPAIQTMLSSNKEEVPDIMIEGLPYVCQILQKIYGNETGLFILKSLFPLILSVPNEIDAEFLSDAIISIYESIHTNTLLPHYLAFLLSLSSSEKKKLRLTSALILELSTNSIDANLEFDKFSELVLQLATDYSSLIRSHIPNIVTNFIDTIQMPINQSQLSTQIILLAHDKSANVRKTVIECLYDFSIKVDVNTKILIVQPALILLLEDSVEQIRLLSLARFPLIINSIGESCPEELIKKYSYYLLSEENNTSYSVSFGFSAVAVAIGKERFYSELYTSFLSALQSLDLRVRRTLAFSLKTYAFIFNPSDLCEVVCTILKDLPYVSIGIVSQLSEFLPLVDDKESLMFCLVNPSSKYSEWRMRLRVSEQLRKCKHFFDPKKLLESAAELIEDDIAIVRKDAALSFAELMQIDDIPILKNYSMSDNHWTRLCAIQICANIKFPHSEIKKIIKKLTKDPVYAVKNEAEKANLSYGFF